MVLKLAAKLWPSLMDCLKEIDKNISGKLLLAYYCHNLRLFSPDLSRALNLYLSGSGVRSLIWPSYGSLSLL